MKHGGGYHGGTARPGGITPLPFREDLNHISEEREELYRWRPLDEWRVPVMVLPRVVDGNIP